MASVVIPAHNEEAVIGRLLGALMSEDPERCIDILVVANGCTDSTVKAATAAATAFSAPAAARVRVISVPFPSKREALRVGDELATVYPRLWVDADVVIGASDVAALCKALEATGALAAGPVRFLELQGRPWVVRWFYDVWTRLPEVRAGLFGRGVVALTAEGHARVTALPPVMGDDLAVSLAFDPSERIVASEAQVLVHTPRTATDLLRRRVRTMTSSAHVVMEIPPRMLSRHSEATEGSRTRLSDLLAITRAEPRLAPKVATFLVVAGLARMRSRRAVRRGDFTTWLRDESSRVDE